MSYYTDNKTKIVCTIGPSSNNPHVLKKMEEKGMDVCRLNFSHGTIESQKRIFKLIRETIPEAAILIDLPGPKIRLGELKDPYDLERGDKFILTSEEIIGTKKNKKASITHKSLPQETKPGHRLFINDGIVELLVEEVDDQEIKCKVLAGGQISSRKGVNTPDTDLSLYFPTKRDIEILDEAVKLKPDFFAASFVRRKQDVLFVKKIIDQNYLKTGTISKIEHKDAIDNFSEILEFSDGIMVARGDLGVETSAERVPIIQKRIIDMCNAAGKPVITATQMLESMTHHSRPTRAEASDVFNAILDGTDAVMLSGETANGKYPVKTVETMTKIISAAESINIAKWKEKESEQNTPTVTEVIAHAAKVTSECLEIKAIIATTRSGNTPNLIAKFRPKKKIIAVTPYIETKRKCRLVWGLIPLLLAEIYTSTDEIIYGAIKTAYEKKIISDNDQVVVVAGSLLGLPTTTNLVQVIKVDDALALKQLNVI